MDTPIWMTPRGTTPSNLSLESQSRGRPLTEAEQDFANALEQLFSEGCHDMQQLAAKLSEHRVVAPISGATSWSLESLGEELHAINSQLDAAYEEHGFGA